MLLISSIISSIFFVRYLDFCPDFFGQVGKRLDKKNGVNFKRSDITIWETNNSNTHIVQHFKK